MTPVSVYEMKYKFIEMPIVKLAVIIFIDTHGIDQGSPTFLKLRATS